MSKTSKKNLKQKPIMSLNEKVDMDILERMLSAEGFEDDLRKQLKLYYNKAKKNVIPVDYRYSKKLINKGRLYARGSLSLQSFKKEIRHALAGKYYYDIDMENCQPRLMLQYCKNHNITHKKLELYVNNRESILESIVKFHEIDREQAKKLVLRLCYLGGYTIKKLNPETQECERIIPDKKLDFLISFKAEARSIAKSVCEIEKDIYELAKKDDTKENKKATTLSVVAQEIEHKCLMGMYDFFVKQKHKVGVLCFDGLMIEKGSVPEEEIKNILNACETYVKKNVKYEIVLAEKKMNTNLSYILPQFSEYVHDDLDCQQKLFKIEGSDKFKFCNGTLYIFDEKTGMYATNIETLYYYLVKNRKYLNVIISVNKDGVEKIDNYGRTAHLQVKVVQFIKTAAADKEWLENTENTSLGYLLFKDGIYNMRNGEFTKGFDPKIVFHTRIARDFPVYNKTEIDEAYNISFGNLFDNPRPMIVAIARALAGDIEIKKFYFCPGRPNAGKSKLALMLSNAFGGYVGNFNAESLAYTSDLDSKDEAAKMRWALLIRFCRIILSNEINMKKKLNANDIKKHSSGGDKLTGRTHQKEEVHFTPHYTLFCMLNDIPQIEPMDEATIKRLTYIEFPYVFVNKEEIKKKTYNKEKDEQLDKKIRETNFINGFIHIILDGYKDFLANGMPDFDQDVKNKWTIDNKQNNEIIDVIKENFEITGDKDDKVTVSDLKKFRDMHKNIFSTISTQRFNEILKDELNLEEGRDSSRYWKGIKRNTKKEVIIF